MFKKAERCIVAPKIAFQGVSGAGKTYSALRFARGFVGEQGKIALIDTENNSASLYANVTDFDVVSIAPRTWGDVTSYWHDDFKQAIQEAITLEYDCLIIDSASHIWQGVLDYKTRLDQRGGNSFVNWNNAGAQFSSILNQILQAPIPVICCFRSKMEYILEKDENGKERPKKVGLAPVTRADSEYEFTLVFEINRSHSAEVSKSRCSAFDSTFCSLITENEGRAFKEWVECLK